MPSSPVLLHIYCPHPLSCCIYIAFIPCLAAYILPSSPVLLHIHCIWFSTFWHCHPYILQHFNGNVWKCLEMFLLSLIINSMYCKSLCVEPLALFWNPIHHTVVSGPSHCTCHAVPPERPWQKTHSPRPTTAENMVPLRLCVAPQTVCPCH